MGQLRQHDDHVEERDNEQAAGPGSSNPMDQAAALLRAGDDAIEQVLSGDSVQFLAASRQLGGQ